MRAFKLALAGAAYYLFAQLGLDFVTVGDTSPIWPATGVGIALCQVMGRRTWIAIFLGAFAANLSTDASLMTCLGFSIGSALEAALGAAIYAQVMRRSERIGTQTETLAVLSACSVAPLASATVGTLSLLAIGAFHSENFAGNWTTWWIGDFVGGLITLPAVIALIRQHEAEGQTGSSPTSRSSLWRLTLVATVTLGGSAVLFWMPAARPLVFGVFPLLLISTYLLNSIASRVTTLLVCTLSVLSTIDGSGPFADGSLNANLLALQLFLSAVSITALALEGFKRMVSLRTVAPVLIVGWLLSGAAFYSFSSGQVALNDQRFMELVKDAEDRIRHRMARYIDNLHGAAGLIVSSEKVTRSEWRSYIETLDAQSRFPGLSGIGLMTPLKRIEIDSFVAERVADGVPNFAIKNVNVTDPASAVVGADDLFVVTYLEPESDNQGAIGLDGGSEKIRRSALEAARDTGQPTISGKISLEQDRKHRPGFLLYVPFYRSSTGRIDGTEARRKAHMGWVYAPFVVELLLDGAISTRSGEPREIDFRMYDGLEIRPETLLHASNLRSGSMAAWTIPEGAVTTRIHLAQREYTMVWTRSPSFVAASEFSLAWLGTLSALLSLATAYLFVETSTFRRRAEELVKRQTKTLADKELLWRTLSESVPVGLFHTDKDGFCTYINRKWTEITGHAAEVGYGLGWLDTLHPDDRTRVLDNFRAYMNNGHTLEEAYRTIRTDGEVRYVNAITTQLKSDAGEVTGYVGIVVDETERRAHGAMLERERLRAIEASKMASLGEMAGGIAHEINNPLAIIVGNASHIRKREDTPADVRHKADRIEHTAQRIAKIIRGLRAFARNADQDPLQPVHLAGVIEDTLALCSERFRNHGVQLDVHGKIDAIVNCRPSQISQVLLNVLNNAHDAVQGQTSPWVSLHLETTVSTISIAVTDSGRGIPANIADRIMEPFFTTKEVGKGTGLGLSIAKGLVEDHGGRLLLDRGASNTRFVIELPTAREERDVS